MQGTEGDDIYDQQELGLQDWLSYEGLGGNDTIRMYNGTALPGSGVDLVQKLVSTDWWRTLDVAYWDAPAGVTVDLQAGWADDAWGSRDVLINVDNAHGSGHDDRLYGSSSDNFFSPNGGHDTVDGRGGIDTVVLPWLNGAQATMDKFSVSVSIDGRSATITAPTDPGWRFELTDVERIGVQWDQWFLLTDYIDPKAMGEQGLTGSAAQRWNASAALGSAVEVSFSFVESAPASGPGSTGFRSFSEGERQVVRDMLSDTSALTGISFVELAESPGVAGQVRFGVDEQLNTKGVSYAPDVAPGSLTAGDVWMDTESMVFLSAGTEGYAALRHEIGHALGLRHPRNVDPGDAWTNVLRAVDDSTTLSVMSGSASADGLFRADWGLLDVTALRHLYGANTVNLNDTVFQVGANDALAQRTLVDDGGVDALDASASPVGVAIDLNPGHTSSVGMTGQAWSAVDNLGIAVGSWIENAVGSVVDDVLLGNQLGNRLEGLAGNDWIDGGDGTDVAFFAAALADYLVSTDFGKVFVAARDGTSGFDTLLNMERLEFSGNSVALDLGVTQSAGGAALLLGTVLPGLLALDPSKQALLGSVIDLFDAGYSLRDLSGAALRLPIWDILTGQAAPSNTAIANQLLTNVYGQAPDAAALAAAVNALDTEAFQGEWLASLASSSAGQLHIGLLGLQQTGLEYV